ncbi:uncharacterized protein LOC119671874 [Teleopsis dalmanni]|uniref:uncharacterized protein LOC119671874 n=1 Tax=Teleopsis dalmanni TaxID=139649 RepID=UPI000D32BBFA|nr:uncharacterized protein LOC119671874 [Teleopsis dalmanni]
MPNINKSKVIAISALLISLGLIMGSIYLHMQKKHHLGRMNTGSRQLNSAGVDYIDLNSDIDISDVIKSNDSSDDVQSSESESSNESNSTEIFQYNELTPSAETFSNEDNVNEICMQCMCENISMCKPRKCGKQSCGVFIISESYWFDAGEPTVSKNEYTNSKDASDYFLCVNDRKCAETTVRAYMKRFSRDCNKDGVIDCLDYILIHLLGPNGCLTSSLHPEFFKNMRQCLSREAL